MKSPGACAIREYCAQESVPNPLPQLAKFERWNLSPNRVILLQQRGVGVSTADEGQLSNWRGGMKITGAFVGAAVALAAITSGATAWLVKLRPAASSISPSMPILQTVSQSGMGDKAAVGKHYKSPSLKVPDITALPSPVPKTIPLSLVGTNVRDLYQALEHLSVPPPNEFKKANENLLDYAKFAESYQIGAHSFGEGLVFDGAEPSYDANTEEFYWYLPVVGNSSRCLTMHSAILENGSYTGSTALGLTGTVSRRTRTNYNICFHNAEISYSYHQNKRCPDWFYCVASTQKLKVGPVEAQKLTEHLRLILVASLAISTFDWKHPAASESSTHEPPTVGIPIDFTQEDYNVWLQLSDIIIYDRESGVILKRTSIPTGTSRTSTTVGISAAKTSK